ncbi:MAG: type II toxin-antitoxin system Phd/YefM family antitoxin [Coriobacteriales bacterium]|jgi:prevent-host-death family protein|nr:type II toxin-antitoxin system Phd/YefM family antitoxin [Coriobacteriales bacterium]
MAAIRPSSDLRNRYNEISDFCHTHREPVYITKNGRDDLVVMSNDEYELLVGRYELSALLDAGLRDIAAGRCRPASEVFANIEQRYGLR